jgi:exopolysaccharide biosynthesis polyprenyl glycosylphosphotransferase
VYSRNLSLGKLQLGALDALTVFLSVLVATWLRHGLGILAPVDDLGEVPWVDYLFPAALCSLTFVALFANASLYEPQRSRLLEAFALLKSCLVGTMVVLTLTFFYRGYSYSRATALLFIPTCFFALILARHLYRIYSTAVLTREGAVRRAVIVGCGPAGRRLAETLVRQPAYYRLLGFVRDSHDDVDPDYSQIPLLGDLPDIARVIAEYRVEEVLIAIPSAPRDSVLAVMGECIRARTKWKIVPDLYELVLDRVHVDEVGGIPLIGLRGNTIVGFNWAMKRAFDIFFSMSLLILLSPLLALIALAVKATSKGPVLYRQTRVGHNGKRFEFLKFRSMYTRNDPSVHQSYTADWIYGRAIDSAPNAGGEKVYKILGDPRITTIGRLLRKTSLDELPQFWNVLRGEMSVVGPRPPLPYEVERYTEWHKRRLEVLPGITGLWQVSGRNALTFDQMIRLDIQYIENWSLKNDLSIVWRTIPAVVFGKAY